MDTTASSDGSPRPVSAQEYQDEISLWLVVAADPGRPARIEGTLVLAQHRGLRLGRAVKVASLLTARDLGSPTRVRTSSDDRNLWMRAINDELGFVPVESEILLHKHRRDPAN